MKTVFLSLCAMVALLIAVSCDSITKMDYKAACKAGDYEAAMQCLDELKEQMEQAKLDVPEYDSGFLGFGGNKEEYHKAKKKCEAAEKNYKEAEKYVEDYFDKLFEKSNGPDNFDAAMDRLEKLHDKYLVALAEACHNYFKIEDMEAPRQLYWSALDKAYKKEIMYLVTSDNAEAADRIVFLLNEIPVDGTKKEGLIGYYEACLDQDDGQDLRAYITYVEHYNSLCDVALDLAINQKKKDIATMIVKNYKPDVIVTKGDSGVKVDGNVVDGNHGYVQHKNNSKESASKKLKEAIAAGDLN